MLAEMMQQAEALIRFVALEQNGIYYGCGEAAWVDSEPVTNTVQCLAGLLERIGAQRDASA